MRQKGASDAPTYIQIYVYMPKSIIWLPDQVGCEEICVLFIFDKCHGCIVNPMLEGLIISTK